MKGVGKQQNVTVIDLNKRSIDFYESLGDEGSSYLMCTENRTHFVEAGARVMAQMVAEEMCKGMSGLQPYLVECKLR